MAREWVETTLGNVIELKRGYDLPQRERIPGTVPLVSSSGVTDHHAVAKVKGPGVVTGRYGTLGQVFFVAEDFWPLNTTLYVRDFKGNDPRFISYFLTGLDYLAYSDKAAVPGLNRNHLHQATVLFPADVREQRAIAHILGTLDDKIELNRRMNETLEAMARALFKSWFVDFDRVRAKADRWENGLSNESGEFSLGSVAAEVPDGWRIGTFSHIAALVRETVNPRESPDKVFSYYSIPAFDSGSEAKRELGKAIKSQKFRVPVGAILLSKLNPEFNRVWLVDVATRESAISSTEFLVLRPTPPFGGSFVYCLCRSPAFRQQLQSLVTGTSKSHQRARAAAVLGLSLLLPPTDLLARFEQVAGPMLQRALVARGEAGTLARLRDTLLPRLVSGDLRLRCTSRRQGARD